MLSTGEWDYIERCPLCDSGGNFARVYEATDPHYRIRGKFVYVTCPACWLVFLNPMPTGKELARLYPEDYYSYRDCMSEKDAVREFFKRMLFIHIGMNEPQVEVPGRLLDIGCGSGQFLYVAREKGWDVHGVEISRAAAELGRTRRGLNIFAGTVRDAAFPNDYFDYIRLNHSFEHMQDPNETLSEIYRILTPRGKIAIGLPNIDGLSAKLFRQYWWYLGAPVHPFNYSVKTASRMIQKHGFEIEGVSYNSDFTGILGSIQIYANRDSDRISSDGMFYRNPLFIVVCHWLSKLLDMWKLGDVIEITAQKK